MVAGCLEGGCHYQEGNLRARRRVERVQQLMKEAGLEPERLEMFNLSSAEGTRFAEIVTLMTERIAKLGPSPIRAQIGASAIASDAIPEPPQVVAQGEAP